MGPITVYATILCEKNRRIVLNLVTKMSGVYWFCDGPGTVYIRHSIDLNVQQFHECFNI